MTVAGLHTEPFHRKPAFDGLWFRDIDLPVGDECFVKGLLASSSFSVIYGEAGCGKSFFTLDLALHVASGWPWRGRKVTQGAVAYIAAEGGHGMRKRVIAFRQHHDIAEGTDLPFLLIPTRIDLLDPKSDTEALIAEIQAAARECGATMRLIVVDTLSRAMNGGNENAPDDMGAFVSNVDRIRQETGAHVAVVHHSGKDAAKGARGHSLLRAATDTEIEIRRDELSRIITATVAKERDGEDGAEFAFRLEGVTVGTDEDGDDITSCVVMPSDDPAPGHGRARVTGTAKVALDLLRRALDEAGEPAPASNHIPAQKRVVRADMWRRYCDSGQITESDKSDTRQKAFKRAADKLQAARAIGVWEGWVWLAK